jgi:hypothetical protein
MQRDMELIPFVTAQSQGSLIHIVFGFGCSGQLRRSKIPTEVNFFR